MFSRTKIFMRKSESWISLSNYVTKTDFKNATGIDTSPFTKKVDLASSKSNVHKLDIDRLKNVPTNLSNLKK